MLISILVIVYAVVVCGQDKALPTQREQPPQYSTDGTVVSVCNVDKCMKYSLVEYLSSGVFVNETEHKAQTGLEFKDSDELATLKPVAAIRCGCCKTYHYCTFYRTLRNTAGQHCYIIQLPNLYQYTSIGVCRDFGNCMGGTCQQRYAYTTLLAWCPYSGMALKFHLFKLRSYCACA